MLEVVFHESTKASMRQTKVYNEKKNKNLESTSYIGKKLSEVQSKKKLESKVIDSQDVVNIGFNLDIGDISDEIDGTARKEIFKSIWNLNPEEKEGENFLMDQRQDLEKLISAAKEGVHIRVWKSRAPYSACGFAFVCSLLKDIDCNISVVSFPKYHHISDDLVLTSADWNCVMPNEFYKFLSYEKDISDRIKKIEADLWEDLKKENSPLRAEVNGKLISVPEDFYDHIIMKNIPDENFNMASLISKILGEYELGISDSWLGFRIKKMVKRGILKVVSGEKVSNSNHIYLKK